MGLLARGEEPRSEKNITGCTRNDKGLLMVFTGTVPLSTPILVEGAADMALLSNKPIQVIPPKTAPKQIPLFEEQDDGQLIPYDRT